MRLLHTTQYTLHEFPGKSIPGYAILSHTWGDEEVLFSDLQRDAEFFHRPPNFDVNRAEGKNKILNFCRIAFEDYGLDYGWVDTCCIDKSSSADLSECINSMYRWYSKSECCITYLSDVGWVSDSPISTSTSEEAFVASRWFTRGWTLQELLAPRKLIFFDRSWKKISTKYEMANEIRGACGVPRLALSNILSYSVAQRMSWASKRETTREEDIAYCLWGIFGINMPLLYGEGEGKAFKRMQEEIIRRNRDETIFAWQAAELPYLRSIFAEHPKDFAFSHQIVSASYDFSERREPYAITHRGLQIDMDLTDIKNFPEIEQKIGGLGFTSDDTRTIVVAQLRGGWPDRLGNVTIVLFRSTGDTYMRCGPLFTTVAWGNKFKVFRKKIYVT